MYLFAFSSFPSLPLPDLFFRRTILSHCPSVPLSAPHICEHLKPSVRSLCLSEPACLLEQVSVASVSCTYGHTAVSETTVEALLAFKQRSTCACVKFHSLTFTVSLTSSGFPSDASLSLPLLAHKSDQEHKHLHLQALLLNPKCNLNWVEQRRTVTEDCVHVSDNQEHHNRQSSPLAIVSV